MGFTVLDGIWRAIFEYPYLPWFVAISLAVVISMRQNTYEVTKFSSFHKERALESQILASEAERKRQEKMIAKLKSIEEEEEVGENEVVAVGAWEEKTGGL